MSHFIRKCECGKVLSQCRCMSNDKSVEIVSPCNHKEREEMSIQDLFKSKGKLVGVDGNRKLYKKTKFDYDHYHEEVFVFKIKDSKDLVSDANALEESVVEKLKSVNKEFFNTPVYDFQDKGNQSIEIRMAFIVKGNWKDL